MKDVILRLAGHLLKLGRILRVIGPIQLLRYWVSPKGKLSKILIKGDLIVIRKGTPDLDVAVTSLSKEFDSSRYLLPSDFGGVIVDAGGYIGTAAIAFSKIFPQSTVISIEPSISNIEILRQNVKKHPQIQVVHGALVGLKREVAILYDPGFREWGFTTALEHETALDTNRMYQVPAFRISDLGADIAEIGLLKLDIEGGELEILTHDRESLSEINVLIIELHDRFLPGCEKAFFDFSENRIIFKDSGEKFLSVRR